MNSFHDTNAGLTVLLVLLKLIKVMVVDMVVLVLEVSEVVAVVVVVIVKVAIVRDSLRRYGPNWEPFRSVQIPSQLVPRSAELGH